MWGERAGVINNVFTPWTYDKYPTVFNQLETQNATIKTVAIADWDVINAIAGAGSLPVDTNLFVPQILGADAITNVDENLGLIMQKVNAWNAAHPDEQWTVLVTTDHGHQPQVGFGHGFQSPDETSTFVIAKGTQFKDGFTNTAYEIIDTTPTVMSIFGGTAVGSERVHVRKRGRRRAP